MCIETLMPCALSDGFQNPVNEPMVQERTIPGPTLSTTTPSWQESWAWQHNTTAQQAQAKPPSQQQQQQQQPPQMEQPLTPPNASQQFKRVLHCGGGHGMGHDDCNAAILAILSCDNCREKVKLMLALTDRKQSLSERVSAWANDNPLLFMAGLLILLIFVNKMVFNGRRRY